jgi:hypothetical protein
LSGRQAFLGSILVKMNGFLPKLLVLPLLLDNFFSFLPPLLDKYRIFATVRMSHTSKEKQR